MRLAIGADDVISMQIGTRLTPATAWLTGPRFVPSPHCLAGPVALDAADDALAVWLSFELANGAALVIGTYFTIGA
jgi:hypothetical protein